MAGFSRLDVAIREADHARTDLHRCRLLLTTARQLVSEERAEINMLRHDVRELLEENETLRQQLWELSQIRSRQLGLEPREPLRVFPMEEA
jgi:hypothetical protein